ncbi:MAG: hypothetical protein AB7V32_10985, partial [Candidatus Berkiella sp.]
AQWCGNEFGTFGAAETMLRDLSSIFLKDFRSGEKLSLKKSLKSGMLLAAVAVAAIGATTAGWAGVMALSFWNAGLTGVAATALTGVQLATAGFVAGISGLMTFVGAKDAIHFFWGLGAWDKQIDFSKEKPLAVLTKEAELKGYYHQHEQRFIADCKFAGKELSAQQTAQLHDIYAQLDNFTDSVFAQSAQPAAVVSLKDARNAKAKATEASKVQEKPKPKSKKQARK